LGYLKFAQIQAAIAFAETFPEPMETVELFSVREEVWQPTTSVTAETVAIHAIEVSTELAGRIVEVGFAPGATVRAGQLLVRLDTSEERAELAAARADARLATLALARNRKLIASGAAA
jgi:membrane fusion protein (multidrug efflux system)